MMITSLGSPVRSILFDLQELERTRGPPVTAAESGEFGTTGATGDDGGGAGGGEGTARQPPPKSGAPDAAASNAMEDEGNGQSSSRKRRRTVGTPDYVALSKTLDEEQAATQAKASE
jgi:hypothetical protein